ncbi:MAG: type VI secretion system protein TssA [Thiohalocapsa sp.]
MPIIDVDALLEPVSADKPAGNDLEYDPAFLELVRLVEGTPERVMGDTTIAPEEPDWQRLQSNSADMLSRSKDLRIALILLRAMTRTESIPGFQAGVQVIRGMIDRYWDDLYPSLDSSDDNDPTERVSILASLIDPIIILTPVRDAPLVRSRVFGNLSYRDIELSEGKAKPAAGTTPVDSASVNAAFAACDIDELTLWTNAATSAIQEVRALSASLSARISAVAAPNFDALLGLLSPIEATLRARLDERRPPDPASQAQQLSSAAPGTGDMPTSASNVNPTVINSRDDVVRVLDALCDYYRRHEPSSPVPLLLNRARRLSTMDFLGIMTDLVPEAMDKVAVIRGPEENTP